jgi:hypothetical protein
MMADTEWSELSTAIYSCSPEFPSQFFPSTVQLHFPELQLQQ